MSLATGHIGNQRLDVLGIARHNVYSANDRLHTVLGEVISSQQSERGNSGLEFMSARQEKYRRSILQAESKLAPVWQIGHADLDPRPKTSLDRPAEIHLLAMCTSSSNRA